MTCISPSKVDLNSFVYTYICHINDLVVTFYLLFIIINLIENGRNSNIIDKAKTNLLML